MLRHKSWLPLPLSLVVAHLFLPRGSTVEFASQAFELDLTGTSLITVQFSLLVLDIIYDALVLILTWVKTADIRKSFSELGIETSLSALVLRDGECGSFDKADDLNPGFQQAPCTFCG